MYIDISETSISERDGKTYVKSKRFTNITESYRIASLNLKNLKLGMQIVI